MESHLAGINKSIVLLPKLLFIFFNFRSFLKTFKLPQVLAGGMKII